MLLMGWEFISINQYLQGLMFRGLVKRTSQANKAAQDQEEWRLELAKFDFDRIHSTTNLRTISLTQLLEEPSSPTTRTILPL